MPPTSSSPGRDGDAGDVLVVQHHPTADAGSFGDALSRLQSHLELQLRHLRAWTAGAEDELAAAGTSASELLAGARRHLAEQEGVAARAFGAFADAVRHAAVGSR